jgi:hypothetical protein
MGAMPLRRRLAEGHVGVGHRSARTVLLAALAVALVAGCDPVSVAPLRELPLADVAPGDPPPEAPAGERAPAGGAPVLLREWACSGYRPWKYIVIHHSSTPGGSAAAFDAYHRSKGYDGLGYHFVITNGDGGPDGEIQVGRRWRLQKWGAHTGGTPDNEYNNRGIGICLVGDFNETRPTPGQLASLRLLVGQFMAGFDVERARVVGHRDAPGASTDCPGESLHGYIHGQMWLDMRAVSRGQVSQVSGFVGRTTPRLLRSISVTTGRRTRPETGTQAPSSCLPNAPDRAAPSLSLLGAALVIYALTGQLLATLAVCGFPARTVPEARTTVAARRSMSVTTGRSTRPKNGTRVSLLPHPECASSPFRKLFLPRAGLSPALRRQADSTIRRDCLRLPSLVLGKMPRPRDGTHF